MVIVIEMAGVALARSSVVAATGVAAVVVVAVVVAAVVAGTQAAVSRHSTPASAHEGMPWPLVVAPDVYSDAR